MSWRHLLHVVGAVVAAVGASMLLPALVSLLYQEWQVAAQITGAAGVTVALGLALWKSFDRPGELTTREGFAAVGSGGRVGYIDTQLNISGENSRNRHMYEDLDGCQRQRRRRIHSARSLRVPPATRYTSTFSAHQI